MYMVERTKTLVKNMWVVSKYIHQGSAVEFLIIKPNKLGFLTQYGTYLVK